MRLDVLTFLQSLKTYLYGDIKTFKRVCTEIEAEESGSASKVPDTGSMSAGGGTSTTTTSQTTNPSGNAGTSGNATAYPINFRCTIPHALAILAAMDILGFLIGTEANARATEKNITLFLAPTVTDTSQLQCLVFIYRHGMSHSFFPKEKISIAAHSSLEGKDLFYLDSNSAVTLNVNTLINLLKVKFDSILVDTSIHSNIESQFDKLVLDDQQTLIRRNLNLSTFALTLKNVNQL